MRSRRGDALLIVCALALAVLLMRSSGGDSWESFAAKFHQNFIQDGRWTMLRDGLIATFRMTALASVIGIAVGVLLSAVRAAADERGASLLFRIASRGADLFVGIMRGTPVMVQLLIWNFTIFASVRNASAMNIAVLAFGLNSAAYVAEIFRGGIASIDRGQMEAARSLGLPYGRSMRLVVLPQALRNIIPMLFNEFVTLLKETSVAGYIGVEDLTRAGQNIQALTMEHSQPLIMVALVYLLIVAVLTRAIGALEQRLHRGRRTA